MDYYQSNFNALSRSAVVIFYDYRRYAKSVFVSNLFILSL